MVNIETLTEEEFQQLPLVIEGESKIVRYAGEGKVVIKFKPTIYSYTANRCGVVEGSDVLRLRASKIFTDVLRKRGISHAYKEINDRWVLADLLLQPDTVPDFTNQAEAAQFYVAPPIEVVVKRMHSGTSKHRYYGMSNYRVRSDHMLYSGMSIRPDDAYPETLVRFDWRNPLHDDKGNRLADEILPDTLADYFINTRVARSTALRVYNALSHFLNEHDIVLYDLCLFISEDGELVFGEISQDCGRFRHFNLGSLDKDVWRAGGSSADVLEKWELLLKCISEGGK